jgi:hypothetical protein
LVTALNLVWLSVAVFAVAAVLVSELRRRSSLSARGHSVMAVSLVMVSLFPCVSASDDLINFAWVSAGLETRSGFGHSAPESSDTDTVVYLALQNLEHLQVTAFYTLIVAFCFFGFVGSSTPRSVLRQRPSVVSRGPPQSEFIG